MVKATPGVEVGDSPIRFASVPSVRFICARCLDRLIEMVPRIKPGQIKQVAEINRKLKASGGVPIMRIKLKCPRGCHDKPNFMVHNINDTRRGVFLTPSFKPDPKAQAQDI